jgi:Ca2+:H+ antiporter
MKLLRYLLIFVPLAVIAEFVLHNPLLTFIFSCIGLIPLAGLLGEATEELAIHTGPKIGGLLNATLGNAAELIITIVALSAGKYELVKASLTGSILGNLLLILGLSLLLGGLKNGTQRFDKASAGMAASMMTLAVIGLVIPTIFEVLREIQAGKVDVFQTEVFDPALDYLSLGVAAVLIIPRKRSTISHRGAYERRPLSLSSVRWRLWRSPSFWSARSSRWSLAWVSASSSWEL